MKEMLKGLGIIIVVIGSVLLFGDTISILDNKDAEKDGKKEIVSPS